MLCLPHNLVWPTRSIFADPGVLDLHMKNWLERQPRLSARSRPGFTDPRHPRHSAVALGGGSEPHRPELFSVHLDNSHRSHQSLLSRLNGSLPDLLYYIHATNDFAERREALAVGIAHAAEIQGGHICEADEYFALGRVGVLFSPHRDRAGHVMKAGDAGPLQGNWRELILGVVEVDIPINDVDL